MGIENPKLKLRPLPVEKQARQLVSKYLGTHHSASSTPFWVERVSELKNKKRHRLQPEDFGARKLTSFEQTFGKQTSHAGVSYQMLHPQDKPENNSKSADGKHLYQFRLNSIKLKLLTAQAGVNPNLGLSVEQLLKMELLGGSNTEQWLKKYIILLHGGLNPHYNYGEFAFGYGEPGQLDRLVLQEQMGNAPDLEPKLAQDCASLGLAPPMPVEQQTPRAAPRPDEHYRPRLTPDHS
tara:strand:+ start:10626 stop:11336 length:711 start_codon:yes stop_codon:yes gene_type:complete